MLQPLLVDKRWNVCTGRFPFLWFKKSLNTKDKTLPLYWSFWCFLIKISVFKLCGIQIVKLLQMSELQGIQNVYYFTCQLQPQKSMFICPSSNFMSLVLYKRVNIGMARLISLIVISYPDDTILCFRTAEITAGWVLVVGVSHIMRHLVYFLTPSVSQCFHTRNS